MLTMSLIRLTIFNCSFEVLYRSYIHGKGANGAIAFGYVKAGLMLLKEYSVFRYKDIDKLDEHVDLRLVSTPVFPRPSNLSSLLVSSSS
jgi:hypothetical protein